MFEKWAVALLIGWGGFLMVTIAMGLCGLLAVVGIAVIRNSRDEHVDTSSSSFPKSSSAGLFLFLAGAVLLLLMVCMAPSVLCGWF